MISLLKFASRAFGSTALAKKKLLDNRKRELKDFLHGNSRCVFLRQEKPKATIIVPVHNHAYHTLQCLLSLRGIAQEDLEILVQDDCSNDETRTLLKKFENISVYQNEKNLGFIGSVNEAVRHARGEFIILLNNDARFLDGSIDEALRLFESERNCGLMGGRISLASGGLQEAAGVIYRDGKTIGYLRHHSINDARALKIRDVDYCSGVFAIVRREVFIELGGFDEKYAPAYYEDTDFCMRLRQAGLRCIYNPDLLVEHFEFGSAVSFRKRALIKRNRRIFMERWRAMLEQGRHFPSTISTANERAAHRLQGW